MTKLIRPYIDQKRASGAGQAMAEVPGTVTSAETGPTPWSGAARPLGR